MQLPKTVKLFGQTWNVQETKLSDDRLGECGADSREIKIEQALKDQAKTATFLHEICHAYLSLGPMQTLLETVSEEWHFDLEELVCLWFETAMFDFLQNNKLKLK